MADQKLYKDLSGIHVAAGFALYRAGFVDEAHGLLTTHGGFMAARDALAEVILALIAWGHGEDTKAREGLTRAEDLMERLGPRENTARTNDAIGYATSVIWLEPLLLLREAREKIPRKLDESPRPIDASLYPQPTTSGENLTGEGR